MGNIRVTSLTVSSKSVVARIWPGTDLITGILAICEERSVVAGCITAIHGSLSKARFVWALPDPSTKMNARYGDPFELEGPLEFLCGSGMIGQQKDSGETAVHLHGIFSDKFQKLYGAHFVQGGNPVMSTMEIFIQGIEDARILRAFDEETEFPLFNIFQGERGV